VKNRIFTTGARRTQRREKKEQKNVRRQTRAPGCENVWLAKEEPGAKS
jgi:hypothetical protein